jgi:ADP-heptose:LPS heptosyltransferase
MLPKQEIKKIAVLRALQLGDLLCAIPAMRALRHAYPAAQVVLLGLPWAKSFTARFSMYFDGFIHFPGYEGLPEQPYDALSWKTFVQLMRSERFDLVIQLQGNGTIVNPLLQQFGARYTAGFYTDDCHTESPLFIRYPGNLSEPERHLLLMQHLGIEPQGLQLEFPLYKQDEKDFNDLLLPLTPGRYICMHPGSRGAWRQWPPAYFAALADYCIEQGNTVVITGTKDEAGITGEMIKCMKHQPIDLTGKTSLGAVGWLIKNAYALIANCTGVSHIASATGTRSIIISMDGEPQRWAPHNRVLHKVIDGAKEARFEEMLIETASMIRLREAVAG